MRSANEHAQASRRGAPRSAALLCLLALGCPPTPTPPPPLRLTDAELWRRVEQGDESLGSVSVGRPEAGMLLHAVPMPDGERWEVLDRSRAWATRETVEALVAAIDAVHVQYPDTEPLIIGHISRRFGGRLWPHKSHQSGRDVDLSFYYLPGKREWYRLAVRETLDVPRTWALVRAFITETDVQHVFLDRGVQRVLARHAERLGASARWLDAVFGYRSRHPTPIVLHAPGHQSHLHVRFFNPVAQRLGVQVYDEMERRELLGGDGFRWKHRAGPREELPDLATAFGTPEASIRAANPVRGSDLEADRVYVIPRVGRLRRGHAEIPARRLPPAPRAR